MPLSLSLPLSVYTLSREPTPAAPLNLPLDDTNAQYTARHDSQCTSAHQRAPTPALSLTALSPPTLTTQVMRASLNELDKAVKGLVVMSGDLEDMFSRFVYQRVPSQWENAGYPCLKPLGSWTVDFFQRLDFVDQWLTMGLPRSFWLSGFFFPQARALLSLLSGSSPRTCALDDCGVGFDAPPTSTCNAVSSSPLTPAKKGVLPTHNR